MFSLFKQKDDTLNEVYDAIIDESRNPQLYCEYGVPDKPIGRFQMIALHSAPVIINFTRQGNTTKAQILFDKIFADIELSFREIGVGDLGVPKKMQRYMKDFNGIIQAHSADDADHVDITRRNVFGDDGEISQDFANYIKRLFKKDEK